MKDDNTPPILTCNDILDHRAISTVCSNERIDEFDSCGQNKSIKCVLVPLDRGENVHQKSTPMLRNNRVSSHCQFCDEQFSNNGICDQDPRVNRRFALPTYTSYVSRYRLQLCFNSSFNISLECFRNISS